MSVAMLYCIPKSGNLTLPKNWRYIQQLNIFASIYDKILSNRIRLWMNIHELQTAYQTNKSCQHQIFTLRILIQISKLLNKPLYVAWLDLEKAFDRVDRSVLIQSLARKGIGTHMLNAIIKLYEVTKCFIDGIGELQANTGIHQGTTSSCYLFIILDGYQHTITC